MCAVVAVAVVVVVVVIVVAGPRRVGSFFRCWKIKKRGRGKHKIVIGRRDVVAGDVTCRFFLTVRRRPEIGIARRHFPAAPPLFCSFFFLTIFYGRLSSRCRRRRRFFFSVSRRCHRPRRRILFFFFMCAVDSHPLRRALKTRKISSKE